MIRSYEPSFFNRIANDPNVRPWLGGGMDYLDSAPFVTDPANVCLLTDNRDGAYIYHFQRPGVYDVHTLALKSARGRPMLRLMRQGLAFMFRDIGADLITTTLPDGNEPALRWAMVAGFEKVRREENAVPMVNGLVGCWRCELTRERWKDTSGKFEVARISL